MHSATLPCGHTKAAASAGGTCRVCAQDAMRAPAPAKAGRPRDAGPGPGLIRKAVNLARAVAGHVAAGMPEVDEATYRARLAACGSCELNAGTPEKPVCRHPSCGCAMRVKCRWAEQRCPHPGGSRWPLPLAPTPVKE